MNCRGRDSQTGSFLQQCQWAKASYQDIAHCATDEFCWEAASRGCCWTGCKAKQIPAGLTRKPPGSHLQEVLLKSLSTHRACLNPPVRVCHWTCWCEASWRDCRTHPEADAWRRGDATELPCPPGKPAELPATCLGGTAVLTAGKSMEVLWELTTKIFTAMLLKLSRSELHWVSYVPAQHGKHKNAGMHTWTRKGPLSLLQCPSSTLYWQSITASKRPMFPCHKQAMKDGLGAQRQ